MYAGPKLTDHLSMHNWRPIIERNGHGIQHRTVTTAWIRVSMWVADSTTGAARSCYCTSDSSETTNFGGHGGAPAANIGETYSILCD